MSIEQTWDLRTNASPRSICVFGASATLLDGSGGSSSGSNAQRSRSSGNPFDSASGGTTGSSSSSALQAIGMVFGTEVGSLHYRAFASTRGISTSSAGLGNSSTSGTASTTSSSQTSRMQVPLGYGSNASTQHLPREYFPMDLIKKSSLLPGSVVDCIPLTSNNAWLVLCDDHRATASGAFAARLVTLYPQSGFHISASNLPRMSCATYHPAAGIVYAAGRAVTTLSSNLWEPELLKQKQQRGGIGGGGFHRGGSQQSDAKQHHRRRSSQLWAYQAQLPALCRSGKALQLDESGSLAVVAVDHSFYALPGVHIETASSTGGPTTTSPDYAMSVKILSLTQSPSQVHPVIMCDVNDSSLTDNSWSCWFLANGRECAVVDVHYDADHQGLSSSSSTSSVRACPRQSTAILQSPIVSAASSWPWLCVLTSDGIITLRSPSCVAIPLQTVEVGQQPNDYFVVVNNNNVASSTMHHHQHWLLAASYSGEARVLHCRPDTAQDLADRLMRLTIDSFGDAFPRKELALALHASFVATSYVSAPDSSNSNAARLLLQNYLEAVLGLVEWESGAISAWPTELTPTSSNMGRDGGNEYHVGTWHEQAQTASLIQHRNRPGAIPPTVVSDSTPAALLTGSAILCLVCLQVSPPNGSLANRAAKECAEKLGVAVAAPEKKPSTSHDAAVGVCEQVADKLLREASSTTFSLLTSSPTPVSTRGHRHNQTALYVDFVEACIWLLRACGRHERALDVASAYLAKQQQQPTPAAATDSTSSNATSSSAMIRVSQHGWSQIKYESYTATHLSELWATQTDLACRLVIKSSATYRLLENNPRLGLSVFTCVHPQNESSWRALNARSDPLAHPQHSREVIQLLQSVHPCVFYDDTTNEAKTREEEEDFLPLDSGRNLAIAYLESAIGVTTGRPIEQDEFDSLPMEPHVVERIASFHDELSLLLLEGVIAERGQQETDDFSRTNEDTELGQVYRSKLKRLLRWPLAKIRSETFLQSLPPSFLQEKALVLGRLGRHEDALRIFYRDLQSLDLALEYCDFRHEQLKVLHERTRMRLQQRQQQGNMFQDQEQQYYEQQQLMKYEQDNAYLPLVRVALEDDGNKDGENRGTTAAIQVLALRRSAIDRAAALRLLPQDVPVSAVAHQFLIPALVDSESEVRRLTVVSALLRARYSRLKTQLTAAQLKAQANLHVVPQLRSLNLGVPLHSTNPFRARTSNNASSISSVMPDVMIVKHFFPGYLVIQAKVTNSVALNAKYERTLSDIAFVVAESSEEAIQPLLQVPIQVLPSKMTGCAWCVLSASQPGRMDGPTAQLTCELRYTVQSVESTSGSATGGSSVVPPLSTGIMGRTYVEELQDLEVHAAHFS